jgi:hypothetical protein
MFKLLICPWTRCLYYRHLYPFCGMICFSYNCYLEQPHCCGCAGREQFCCITCDFSACKPSRGENPDICCYVQEGKCTMGTVHAFCSARTQMFCLATKCAIPTNDEMPCICNVLGFTCCYQMKLLNGCNCCSSEGELQKMHDKLLMGV